MIRGCTLLVGVVLFGVSSFWGLFGCWGISDEVWHIMSYVSLMLCITFQAAFTPGQCYYTMLTIALVPMLIYFFILKWVGYKLFVEN